MLTLVMADGAYGASLCETRYSSRADLERTLRSENGRFFAGQGVRVALVSSPTRLTLWWLTTDRSRAYPAIACVEKVQSPAGGLAQQEAEVNCHGALETACKGLRRDIAKAKF